MKRILPGAFLLPLFMAAAALGQQFPDMGPTSVYHIELAAVPDGGLVLVWTQYSDGGVDLFAARSMGDTFSPPVRVNRAPGSLNTIPIDEMRPSVAVGPGGRVAIAWTDADFDVHAAISTDGGRSFGAPLRLNQDTGDALQEFPDLAFDAGGVLHAVWNDPRIAEGFEEPADLYYARIENGRVAERNLTANQEASVCGCCLPHIRTEANLGLTITFRNTTDDGYRDPFRITAGPDGRFSEPRRVSPPIWEIDACPIAGPIGIGDMTLWLDGSTGVRRLLSAWDPSRMPDVVLTDGAMWSLRYPPRLISASDSDTPLLLVPGRPASYVLGVRGHSWRVVEHDLPGWATSAAIRDGRLLIVGVSPEGSFQHETREFDID